MTDKYLDKYRIPSARLPSWDYGSNGEYFITICTAKRKHYFGEIINDIMHLSEPGKKAYQYWMEIPGHFPFVSLDEFVIMPNHTHGIIIVDKPWEYGWDITPIGGNITSFIGNITPFVETGHALSLRKSEQSEQSEQSKQSEQFQRSKQSKPSDQTNHPTPPHPRFRNPGKNTISSMVGSFKSAVTNWCNENKYPFGWQSRFHDHIIRDKDEFNRIRNYIINNPINWEKDKFFNPKSGN